jgi:Cys-rich repeat protein
MKKQVRGAAALRGVVCACAALGGCAVTEGDELGATTQEIVGGTTATSATMRREVGRWGGCTATLIAPQWVITAGHCQDYQELVRIQPGGSPTFDTSTSGSSWATSAPGVTAVDRVMYLGATTDTGAGDVMLLRLATAVPASVATPTSLATAAPTSGTVTTWGQGCNNVATGAGGGVMRFRESAAGAVTGFLCPGDSGGPRVVGARGANGAVFAVNSAIWGATDAFGDVVAKRAEILGIIAEWSTYPATDIDAIAWCAGVDEQRLWGDVDGDGDPDALCHNRATGARGLAQNNLRLIRPVAGASATFCGGSGKTLLTGDFNRDGRTDHLCHGGGAILVDYASAAASSRYGTADFSLTTSFCSHPTARLHTGDFDADGRTDLLCHDVSTGQMWIDFAAPTGGPFHGVPDWDPGAAARWCVGDWRLYVGEANGDGATDLFCVNTVTGAVALQYSDRNRAPFAGGLADDHANSGQPGVACTTNAQCAEGQRCELGTCRERLCVGAGALRVADISGDGRSDLVCEYPNGRSFALRTFAGSPDGVPANALDDGAAYYTSARARFRPRTAHAAARPSNRW